MTESSRPTTRAAPPLDAELALSRFTAQRAREVRRQTALASGIKLLTRGAVVGLCALAAAALVPPHLCTPVVVPLGVISAIAVGFGGMRLTAAYLLRRTSG